ncbi:MAG: hypothetical protein LBT27_07870 [Prevotellaceae bacterium]|jgi:hypothetical protein|nr:hypothetical protein [Prevotellaceae bacterium]
MKNLICIIIVFIFCVFSLSAQTMPVVPTPKVPTVNPIVNQYKSIPSIPVNPQQNNQNYTNDSYRIYNDKIKKETEEYQKKIEEDKQIENAVNILITKGFPSHSHQKGTPYFYQAFDEIYNMLKGNQSLNLGRAIFLVENAFYNNTLDYATYNENIKSEVEICKIKIKEEELDESNNLVKNMMLFRLISDTLKVKNNETGKTLTHLPIKYNYDDYNSKKEYDSHFVTKLMKTGIGQCYSMPLYYLILAEELNTEAYWSLSPLHSFIKIQDEKQAWYNLELTCGAILSDTHYMNSGYIKAEAIRNKIYLEPLSKTDIIAEMLLMLARCYFEKYGLDDFYLKCVDTSMLYATNKLTALIQKSIYQTRLTLNIAYLLNAAKPEELKKKSPEGYKQYEKMHELYKQIDNLGYEEYPTELYTKWLKYVANQKKISKKSETILSKQPKLKMENR